jgi:cellulose synthase (UDP-forming)
MIHAHPSLAQRKKAKSRRLRRQWGTEARTAPLPTIHPRPSDAKITISRLAIVFTVMFWAFYVISTIVGKFLDHGPQSFKFTAEAFGYLIVVSFLTFSALCYLLARQGAFQRFRDHVRVPRAELDRHFAASRPGLTVLVPSYSEEPHVVRATLLSAALQEYPDLSVVLLLDDPPKPSDRAAIEHLRLCRGLADDITLLLAEPRERFVAALSEFEQRGMSGGFRTREGEFRELAAHYYWAAEWLRSVADEEQVEDFVDEFFVDQVLGELAGELELVSSALHGAANSGAEMPRERMSELYRRLAWTFAARLSVFERKTYASSSHEPNKAMNLNAYIGLMGGRFREFDTPNGSVLVPMLQGGTDSDDGKIVTIPDSEFILTLDADSMLLRDYCLRLVYFLEQPDNARVAVTQTPYSSFRGANTRLGRLAGATTDLQHILHQGMTHYGATFWVGANAVIRKAALEEIVETEWVGGFEVRRYVQDRTVIEDTESSLDLVLHGWGLANYPERLSYSATPPDFGSLIVQRRRWANGGLLILPKLWSVNRSRRRRGEPVSRIGTMLRLNYMASIAWSSFGLIFLLAYPYDGALPRPAILLAAVPYFVAMASDLHYCGYKRTDVFRIYGFNFILLPVNLAGVFKSIEQAVTGKKIPFARTPKVKKRTVSPVIYVVIPFLIVGFSAVTLWHDVSKQNIGNALFAGTNTMLALWAIVACMGIGHSFASMWSWFSALFFVEVRSRPVRSRLDQEAPELDWQAVLYHGSVESRVPHHVAMQSSARDEPAVHA